MKKENKLPKKVAGIILAAGGSSRFGSPKQLSLFHGKTFIETVIETAVLAGLSPVVVVLGANAPEIQANIGQMPDLEKVKFVNNPDWQSGQSSSVRVGIQEVKNICDAAIFLLTDQPQTKKNLIKKLVNQFQIADSLILAPSYQGKRGNPVLFAKQCFGKLEELQGDMGGRKLFTEYAVEEVEWCNDDILFDVDLQQDVEELNRKYE